MKKTIFHIKGVEDLKLQLQATWNKVTETYLQSLYKWIHFESHHLKNSKKTILLGGGGGPLWPLIIKKNLRDIWSMIEKSLAYGKLTWLSMIFDFEITIDSFKTQGNLRSWQIGNQNQP